MMILILDSFSFVVSLEHAKRIGDVYNRTPLSVRTQ